jgi:DNA-directed RNA polymerase subunit RPC12/RpoP
MAEVLRCEHCASRDLTPVSDGEYTCNHCKSRILLPGKTAPQVQSPLPKPAPPRVTPPSSPSKPQTLLQKAGTVLLILVLLGDVVALTLRRAEQRADRARRASIERSVSESLNARFRAPRSGSGTGRTVSGSIAGPGSRGSEAGETEPAAPPQTFGENAIEAEKAVSATFTELTPLPDSIGNVYFVGIYKNTGEVAIDHPRVEITLLGPKKQKLAVAQGYAASMSLSPGQEIPVKALAQQAPAYDSASFTVTPERLKYGTGKHFKLSVEGARLAPAKFGGYDLTGTLRNKDSEAAQHVQLVVLFRDDKRQIVGLDNGYLAQKVLSPGDECPFRVHASQVRGKPVSFTVYTTAMAAR